MCTWLLHSRLLPDSIKASTISHSALAQASTSCKPSFYEIEGNYIVYKWPFSEVYYNAYLFLMWFQNLCLNSLEEKHHWRGLYVALWGDFAYMFACLNNTGSLCFSVDLLNTHKEKLYYMHALAIGLCLTLWAPVALTGWDFRSSLYERSKRWSSCF